MYVTATPWGTLAKIKLALMNMDIKTLAHNVDMTRPYTSSIINGRVVAPISIKKISDFLRIPDSNEEAEIIIAQIERTVNGE